MKILISLVLLAGLVFFGFYQEEEMPDAPLRKMAGVSLVNPPKPIVVEEMMTVKRIAADWVAVIPFGFSRQGESEVHFNNNRQWWGERLDGAASLITMAHQNGLKVMLKPHVWMGRGWIGDYEMNDEAGWQAWEASYKDYIMAFAKLADSLDVELLCVGTEYKKAVLARPEYWTRLIGDIRGAYKGSLTYAANWDNYEQVTFWSDLDYIGIDAYFPLVFDKNPDVEAMVSAWLPIKKKIKDLQQKVNRPVLFTEYGYQSADGAAGNHWEVDRKVAVSNMKIQEDAYEALFRAYWNEPWFHGGFLWKWHLRAEVGGVSNPDFTPQGKPVEATIRKWYESNGF